MMFQKLLTVVQDQRKKKRWPQTRDLSLTPLEAQISRHRQRRAPREYLLLKVIPFHQANKEKAQAVVELLAIAYQSSDHEW